MTVLVELIVAMLQVASILVLLYGLSLTIDNGLNKALTFAASKVRQGVSRTKIDGVANAA
ncbi:MAG TPA: hypothetical protein VKZ48_06705 [Burkholderiales bacterium]|nr:hypothetical protein [Burkholderiales bacterium]